MLTRWTSGEISPTARITIGRVLAFWGAAFVGVVGGGWLAVRWLPIPEWTVPAAVVVMLAGLPVLALTAWLHRSARPISPVPTVASTTTVGRIEAIARPHFTWSRASRGGAAAIVALIVLVALWAGLRALGIGPAATLRTQGRITANDRVFVADFEPASDTGLGQVVAALLRTEIARSQSIRLVDDNDRQNTLVAMGRPASMRVGSAVAREFSQRANVKAYLRGSVTAIGTSYLLRAVLVETRTGAELAAFSESAHSGDDVIHAVDRMGRDVRDRLGASLREIRTSPELAFAVTPSLEAAHLYSDAVRASGEDQRTAISLLARAVAIDTEFAMAYRPLASFYETGGDLERAQWAAASAFRFRAKLPPDVQRLVEGTYYYMPAAYDLDKSIAAYEALAELSPSVPGLNNLGWDYVWNRDFERSLVVFRQALKVDSTNGVLVMNFLRAMWATDRKNETREYLNASLSGRGLSALNAFRLRAMLAAAELKPDSAEAALENALRTMPQLTPSQRSDLYVRLAGAQRERGRLARSLRSLARVSNLTPAADTARGIASTALSRAGIIAWDEEQPREAHRLLDSLVAKHPPDPATALGYPWTELATAYAQAGDAAKARELLAMYEQRANANMKTRARQDLELAHGWTAVADRRYADAITAFRAADVRECTNCALAPLAHAYDLAGQPDSAIAVFERYVSTNQFLRYVPDASYLAGTYKRLGELYDRKGDTAKAETYYSRFVDLWKDADPELQPKVSQVRQRLAALKAGG
jgi:tetratricopeptide (TPR) repeat protein